MPARRKKKLVERDSVLRVAADRARGGG